MISMASLFHRADRWTDNLCHIVDNMMLRAGPYQKAGSSMDGLHHKAGNTMHKAGHSTTLLRMKMEY